MLHLIPLLSKNWTRSSSYELNAYDTNLTFRILQKLTKEITECFLLVIELTFQISRHQKLKQIN